MSSNKNFMQAWVVQRYIDRPFTINRKKFDMRCWVLLTPDRRIYLFRQAVCRVASVPFSLQNLSDRFTHLTNHCIQTEHPDYGSDLFVGATNELFMPAFHSYVRKISSDCLSVSEHLFPQIRYIVRRSIAALEGKIGFSLKTVNPLQNLNVHCFQLLGFDFIVDDGFACHLLEINATPASAEEKLSALVQTMLPLVVDCVYPRSCVCHDRKVGSLSHPPSPVSYRQPKPEFLSNPLSPISSAKTDELISTFRSVSVSEKNDFSCRLEEFSQSSSLDNFDRHVASVAIPPKSNKAVVLKSSSGFCQAAAAESPEHQTQKKITKQKEPVAVYKPASQSCPSSNSPSVSASLRSRTANIKPATKRSPWDLQLGRSSRGGIYKDSPQIDARPASTSSSARVYSKAFSPPVSFSITRSVPFDVSAGEETDDSDSDFLDDAEDFDLV